MTAMMIMMEVKGIMAWDDTVSMLPLEHLVLILQFFISRT